MKTNHKTGADKAFGKRQSRKERDERTRHSLRGAVLEFLYQKQAEA